MWTYKSIDIQVDDNGLFEYCFQNKYYREDTLEKAKRSIEENTRSYYKITEQDYKKLMAKLSSREKHFISSILQELEDHANSAYCEQGLNLEFEYELKDFDLDPSNSLNPFKNNAMTKQEALKALKEGKKITHEYFSPDEWMSKEDEEFYKCESGFMPIDDFWKYRTEEAWQTGWSIYNK